MKKFNLNVATRLIILINLPEQGSVVDMIAKRNVRKKIDFSSKEVEDYKIKNSDGKIEWAPDTPTVEVEFNDSEVSLLKGIIEKLDKSSAVTDSILDFAEEIMKE